MNDEHVAMVDGEGNVVDGGVVDQAVTHEEMQEAGQHAMAEVKRMVTERSHLAIHKAMSAIRLECESVELVVGISKALPEGHPSRAKVEGLEAGIHSCMRAISAALTETFPEFDDETWGFAMNELAAEAGILKPDDDEA